ncbi:MAG: iron-containing alcohol dehydrogenase [Succinivibrio sp.]|nr:iron-containing alcohol dehydrogenase [Succinivibrio sp.]
MDNFFTRRGTAFYFGLDQETHVGAQIKAVGGLKVLVFYTRECVQSGLIDTVRRSLGHESLDFYEIELEHSLPFLDKIAKVERICEDRDIDFVLAIGDEHVVNFAKAVASGARFLGDVFQLFREQVVPQNALPLGVISTVPGSGYEQSSSMSVVEQQADGTYTVYHMQSDCLSPRFAILNPELILEFPERLGEVCANIIGSVVESYFTNTHGVELTDRVCEGILVTVHSVQKRLQEDPLNYESLSNLMWAGVLAHGEISQDRQVDLALERFTDALQSLYGCTHAQGLALVLPVWLEYALNKNVMRVAQFAARTFFVPFNYAAPEQTAREGIRRLRDMFRSLNLPCCYEDFKGDGRDISRLLNLMQLKDDTLIGSYMKLDRTACEVILSMILVAKLQSA